MMGCGLSSAGVVHFNPVTTGKLWEFLSVLSKNYNSGAGHFDMPILDSSEWAGHEEYLHIITT